MTEKQAETIIALLQEIRDNTSSSNITLESIDKISNEIIELLVKNSD